MLFIFLPPPLTRSVGLLRIFGALEVSLEPVHLLPSLPLISGAQVLFGAFHLACPPSERCLCLSTQANKTLEWTAGVPPCLWFCLHGYVPFLSPPPLSLVLERRGTRFGFRFAQRTRTAARACSDVDRKSTRLNSSHLGISYA